MVVGYSLGNRNDTEDDIRVLTEDDENVITYSKSLPMVLSRMCRNNCPYCGFHRKDNVVVPYSTIRVAKDARGKGAREVLFVSGERPDKSPHIRATLDLWGFDSYISYVYTVCELAFLEGLIPVVEAGFLSPVELKQVSEVAALVKIMLDTVDSKLARTMYKNSPGKKEELRFKSLQWTGKLKFPTITGLMVGIGESKSKRIETLEHIAKCHKEYGHIHEVLIQDFVPEPNTPFERKKAPDKRLIIDTVEMARSILPEDVPVTVNMENHMSILDELINAGVRDLGRLTCGQPLLSGVEPVDINVIKERVEALGFTLQQRFPLRKSFIQNELYSKKIGQVFDNYRYKIKKDAQDKLKEAKSAANES